MEILIVDDGSRRMIPQPSQTNMQAKYPDDLSRPSIRKTAATARRSTPDFGNATGIYFKVVDSDDWVNEDGLPSRCWRR